MFKTSPANSKLRFQRRAPALLGILALALLQISVASHQFEHLADHGFGVCQSCSTLNQLDDALIPQALPVTFPIGQYAATDATARPFEGAPVFATYRSRAPPYS
ncbi:MAG: hypothetical protein WBM45_14280 [Woeseiaceae bacterium]|jgi:hypothetical protein